MGGKKNPIHGHSTRPFYQSKLFIEAVSSVPPILGAAYAAFKANQSEDGQVGVVILVVVCLWLVGVSVVKIINAKNGDSNDELVNGHDGILAALHVVHATVARVGRLETSQQKNTLRVTFHRVVPPLDTSEYIEQITPYVGGGGGGQGRKFSMRSGITGSAIREKQVFLMDRTTDKYEDYLSELIRDWSYIEADARKVTSDRYSAMAVPVQGRRQDVLGVIYLDSSEKNFFASDEMQQAVIAACFGVTTYIGERYV